MVLDGEKLLMRNCTEIELFSFSSLPLVSHMSDFLAICGIYPVYKKFASASSMDPSYSYLIKHFPGENECKNDSLIGGSSSSNRAFQAIDKEFLQSQLALLRPGPAPGFKESVLGLGEVRSESGAGSSGSALGYASSSKISLKLSSSGQKVCELCVCV